MTCGAASFHRPVGIVAFDQDHFTIGCEILFLDATDSVLVQRYKESRRRHPLAPKGMPLDGIRLERNMLEELKNSATQVIDTSSMKPAQLKEKIVSRYSHLGKSTLSVNITSFGFKYGIPIDADLVFDVRFCLIRTMWTTFGPTRDKTAMYMIM